MHALTFYFDVISPYAYLAFDQLPRTLQGLSYTVSYQPVLFGALLKHHGQLGPAEIAGKREWTYRQSLWLAREQGLSLRIPAAHPFNPLPLLRLAVSCDAQGQPNRHVCERLFRHVWGEGLAADDPQRLHALREQLQPIHSPEDAQVKERLRLATEDALAKGVFGVPTLAVDGLLFWGLDALPMLRQYLDGDPWFRSADWQDADHWPVGVVRAR